MNYRVLNELENNIFMEDYEKKTKNKVQITVIHDNKVLQPPIGLVNLDSNKTKEHVFRDRSGYLGKVVLQSITEQAKKIMKIRSSLKLVNQTENQVEILFYQNQKMSQQMKIAPYGDLYVPFDETNS